MHGKNSKGKMCVNKIELNPSIEFDNDFVVSKEEMDKISISSLLLYCQFIIRRN